MAGKNILASAATSASYNMVLQLVFRVMTFVLNAFILRSISRDMLGVVNVRLTLLYTTTLFVAREAFRRACLNRSASKPWAQVINLLWCILPIGMLCALVFGSLWAFVLQSPSDMPHYKWAVFLFAVSTVIELVAEPLWIVSQMYLFVKLKVLVEGTALGIRCLLSVVLIVCFPQWGLLAFAVAQVVFTFAYSAMYFGYWYWFTAYHLPSEDVPFKSFRDLFPRPIPGKPLISWPVAALVWSFFKQSFLKQILTEGERYVMTIFDVLSFADQGVYDVINNLGSLVARFVFLPIEDSSYLFFSQTLHRGVVAAKQPSDSIHLASQVLESLLKGVTLVGLTFLVYGYAYSYLVLDIYGGSILSSGTGPTLLRWFCLYVLVLAVNGVTECFAFATMSKDSVDRYNHKMLLFSVFFLVTSWYLTGVLGSVGFTLANCLNMVARIIHSVYYIRRFFEESAFQPLSDMLPSPAVLAAYTAAFIVSCVSERLFCCQHGWAFRVLHIAVGGSTLLIVAGVIYVKEQKLIRFVKEQFHRRRGQSSGNKQS